MTTEQQKVAVVFPAAGQGTRMGGMKKQYRTLHGKPLFIRSILPFEHASSVDDIIIVTDRDHIDSVKEIVASEKLRKVRAVVEGDISRQKSVMKGLQALSPDIDYVLVHDAVRPFITEDEIEQVIRATQAYNAAALAVSVSDALRKGADGLFGESQDRTGMYRMQTPQGFKRDILVKAYEKACELKDDAHDDVAVFQKFGQEVRIIEGSNANIKITTPKDWHFAQQFWQVWESENA